MRNFIILATIVTALSFSSSSNATVIYQFSGIITQSSDISRGEGDSDNFNRLFDGIEVGTAFSGEFIYDPTPSIFFSSDTIYETFSTLSINVESLTYATGRDLDALSVRTNSTGSELTYLSYSDFSTAERVQDQINIEFGDRYTAGNQLVDSNSFPEEISPELLLTKITIAVRVGVDDCCTNRTGELLGEITRIGVIPVPASIWLFISGMLALCGFKRIKKSDT